jgi:hypothetical protein
MCAPFQVFEAGDKVTVPPTFGFPHRDTAEARSCSIQTQSMPSTYGYWSGPMPSVRDPCRSNDGRARLECVCRVDTYYTYWIATVIASACVRIIHLIVTSAVSESALDGLW